MTSDSIDTIQELPSPTYVLVCGSDREIGIRCLVCGRTSWNPIDVEERYCARCYRFHDDECPPALPPFPPVPE